MPDWRHRFNVIGYSLENGELETAHRELLALTEELGALVEAERLKAQPSAWDDPIWPVGSDPTWKQPL